MQTALDGAARYLLSPHVSAGWYAREMDLLATGTGYAWLSRLLGWSAGAVDERAAASAPGAHGVTFAPHLAGGEQGALWDASLRGSVHGLTLQHGAGDLARAFLEGVCFEIRRCVEVLAETSAAFFAAVARTPAFDALFDRLKGINEQLWDVEDAIRLCEAKGDFGPDFIRLARSVYRTNDLRAAIKREINTLLGSDLVEEKSYAGS